MILGALSYEALFSLLMEYKARLMSLSQRTPMPAGSSPITANSLMPYLQPYTGVSNYCLIIALAFDRTLVDLLVPAALRLELLQPW